MNLKFLPSYRFSLLSSAILVAGAASPVIGAETPAAAAAHDPVFAKNVAPLLQKYCYECHGNGKHKGDISLDADKSLADIHKAAKKWEAVMHMVRTLDMPPDDAAAQPTAAERDLISNWVEKELFRVDPSNPDPGRVTIHRLNRNEYNNTVRDLVGVEFQPADDFPADNSGYGFDNIADVLSLPPVLLEKYLSAATRIVDEAIPTEQRSSRTQKFRANLMEVGFNAEGDPGTGYMPLGALEEDNLAVRLNFAPGDYKLRVHAFATPKGKYASSDKPLSEKPIILTCMIDESIIGEMKIAAPEGSPEMYELRVSLPAGRHRLAVVNRHLRGGEHELTLRNGRVGPMQGGTVWIDNIEIEGPFPTATVRVPANKLEIAGEGKFLPTGGRVLTKEGEVAMRHTVPAEGEYILRAMASAQQAGKETARMEFRIDGKPVQSFDVLAPAKLLPPPGQRVFSIVLLNAAPQVYEYRVKLPAGEHRFSAAFVNDFAEPDHKNPNLRDRNLIIDHLEIAGVTEPAILPERPEQIKKLFAKAATPAAPTGMFAQIFNRAPAVPTKAEQARTIIGEFARRAWRRPVETREVDELLGLYTTTVQQGESFEAGVKLAMQAVLVSPHFLFRGEVLPTATATNNGRKAQPIGEFTLASRLSYFLWSSMPDDELSDLAGKGLLRKNLDAQVRRMLASPKAQAFVTNFAGQWLEIRNLKFAEPDKKLFPDFDDALRTSMREETERFFDHILRNDRSVLEFLTGDYTFVNERLAKHYGIPDITGENFRQVSLAGTPRRGVLTQGSVLTITSNPTRTSPVKRGKWVLEDLLGTPPPPPPPNVPDLPNNGQPVSGSLRHQMEEHRANPTCASCHSRMDPIGFGLENFDAIGAFRTKDGEFPVDAGGKLSTGESFATASELVNILSEKRREQFVRNISEKMLIYSLGRGLERTDRPAVEQIMQRLTSGGYRFSELVLGVVKSVPFDQQRVEPVALASK